MTKEISREEVANLIETAGTDEKYLIAVKKDCSKTSALSFAKIVIPCVKELNELENRMRPIEATLGANSTSIIVFKKDEMNNSDYLQKFIKLFAKGYHSVVAPSLSYS